MFGYTSTSGIQRFTLFFLAFHAFQCFPVGLVHYLWDPQTSFFNKIFIKNGSYGTIHIFKNYFVTVFSIFSKISGIQTHPKIIFHINLSWIIKLKLLRLPIDMLCVNH